MAVIIRLCEHGRDGQLASIGRDDEAARRVEGAEDGGHRQALLQPVKALLFGVAQVPWGVRAPLQCQWDSNISVAVDEAAVVVAQPHEVVQLDVGWRGRPIPHAATLRGSTATPTAEASSRRPGPQPGPAAWRKGLLSGRLGEG